MNDLARRALVGWLRTGGAAYQDVDITVEDHAGKKYVVLRARSLLGLVIKVYRVRPDGILKGLRRYPETIKAKAPEPVSKLGRSLR